MAKALSSLLSLAELSIIAHALLKSNDVPILGVAKGSKMLKSVIYVVSVEALAEIISIEILMPSRINASRGFI